MMISHAIDMWMRGYILNLLFSIFPKASTVDDKKVTIIIKISKDILRAKDTFMPHVWSFYALNKCIYLEEHLSALEALLGSTLSLATRQIKPYHQVDIEEYKRIDLKQDLEESEGHFVLLCKKEFQVPALLSYSGNSYPKDIILEWLKSELGVVIYPVKLDSKSMIDIADAFMQTNERHISTFYDTKFLLDIETQNENLKKMDIEIDKESVKILSSSQPSPLNEAILPYIFQETGIRLPRLPLSMIVLTGLVKIKRDAIITATNIIEDKVLMTTLNSIQFDPVKN